MRKRNKECEYADDDAKAEDDAEDNDAQWINARCRYREHSILGKSRTKNAANIAHTTRIETLENQYRFNVDYFRLYTNRLRCCRPATQSPWQPATTGRRQRRRLRRLSKRTPRAARAASRSSCSAAMTGHIMVRQPYYSATRTTSMTIIEDDTTMMAWLVSFFFSSDSEWAPEQMY